VGITELPEFAHLVSNPRFPRDSAYALIRRQPFHFPTGTAQSYNNSGFILLGLVIEKASGMTYEEYVEQRIFAPLGMTRSMYCNSLENVPRRAHGYAVQNGALRRGAMNVHTWPYAAGSLCSTAGDLVRWLQALHGGKVLSPASYAEMIAPSTLLDGTPVRYGLGIGVGRDAFGLSYIGHGGAIDGFRAEVNWYPEARLAVVALVNTSGNVDPAVIVGELATAVLPATRPATKPFAGDATPLVGRYRGPSRGREMIVEVTATPQGPAFSVNGSPPRVLPWVEGTTFLGGGAILTFKRAASGPATELRFDGGGGTFYVLKRE
jgi:CubicO group peptidase (beta-lactamase class C family)